MKKIYMVMLSFMLAFTGIMLASCGTAKYDNIILTANVDSIALGLGESRDVVFSIENFNENMSEAIHVYTDNSVVKIESNVKLGGGKTKVTISGIHGGTTTLRAKSFEGEKITTVDINVNEPLKNFEKKAKLLFVNSGENGAFTPSINDYTFYPETTNERNLKYYYMVDGIKTEFTSVEANEQNDEMILNFKSPNGNFQEIASHAREIFFFAEFFRESDNTRIQIDNSFFALKFLDPTKLVTQLAADGTELQFFEIVSNVKSKAEQQIAVVVPSISTNIELECEVNNEFIYVAPLMEGHKVVDVPNGRTIFYYNVKGNSIKAGTSKVTFKAYYQNFEDYYISKTYDAKVKVAPTSITVNDEIASSNVRYTLFNQNKANHGNVELKLGVFPQDASFSGIKIKNIKNNAYTLTYKGKTINANTVIDDLSFPVIARGVEKTEIRSSDFTFEIVSDLLDNESPVEHRVVFDIQEGVGSFGYKESSYIYNSANESTGIFLEVGSENIFDGLTIAPEDAYVGKMKIDEINGASKIVNISQVIENGKHTLKLNVRAIKEGLAQFEIMLANGTNIRVTFKVVTPFKDLSTVVIDSGTAEEVTEITPDGTNFKTVASIVIKNSLAFNGSVSIRINEPYGGKIEEVTYSVVGAGNIISLSKLSGEYKDYKIFTNQTGNVKLVFTAKGKKVSNFMLETSEKSREISITSFMALSEFNVLKDGINAHNVQIYHEKVLGEMGGDSHLKTAEFEYKFNADSTGFFNPTTNETEPLSKMDNRFIYYTCKDAGITESGGGVVDKAVYGKIYEIGNFGVLDLKNNTFTLSPQNGPISFKLFANVRQYNKVYLFEMRITSRAYVAVSNIGLYNYLTRIDLDATNKEIILNAYALPSNVTNSKVIAKFIPDDRTQAELVHIETLKENEVETNFFKITFDPEILKITERASGVIKLLSAAWVNEDGSITAEGKSIPIAIGDGSREKPLNIGSGKALLSIGQDEVSMGMHYKISNIIDMSAEKGFLPIGAKLAGESVKILPFTGSIVGSNEAGILGVNIITTVDTGTKSGYYAGLFAEIAKSAVISNIRFEGKINILDKTISGGGASLYAGLLTAKNFGNIINCSFSLGDSSIDTQGVYVVGGVAGENYGAVVNVITNETYNSNLMFMQSSFTLHTNQPEAGVAGGIFGRNYGYISYAKHKDAKLYNYSLYSAYVNLKTDSSLAMGAIAGENLGVVGDALGDELLKAYLSLVLNKNGQDVKISSVAEDDYSFGVLVGGKVESSNDNVGGVFGLFNNLDETKFSGISYYDFHDKLVKEDKTQTFDKSMLVNAKTRTFVRGANNVGAIIGNIVAETTTGEDAKDFDIKDVLVEATDDAIREGKDASLVIRNKTDKFDGLTKPGKLDPLDNEGTYDSVISKILFGEVVSGSERTPHDNKLVVNTYYSRKFVENSIGNTDSYLGDFIEIGENGAYVNQFQFKITVDQIGIAKIKNEMASSVPESGIPGLYIFYYKAEDQSKQSELNASNIIKTTDANYPFELLGEVLVTSPNQNILAFDERANITLRGTGAVKVKIRSALNAQMEKYVYIFVTPYVQQKGATKIYATSTREDYFVGEGSIVSIYENRPVNLYLALESGHKETAGNTLVKLVGNEEGTLSISYGKVETTKFTTETVNGMGVTFRKNPDIKVTGGNTVSLNSAFSFKGGSTIYTGNINETKLNITVQYKKGSTDITTDYGSYEMSPKDKVLVDVINYTDNEADTLKMTYGKFKDGEIEVADYFQILEGKSSTDFAESLFKVEVLTKNNQVGDYKKIEYKLKIVFNRAILEEDFGTYRMFFESDNGYSKYIDIKVMKQGIENIFVDNYQDLLKSSKTDYVSELTTPGKYSALNVMLHPSDADFDRVEILNAAGNSATGKANALLSFYDKYGRRSYEYNIVSGGISINRAVLMGENYDINNIKIGYIMPTEGVVNDANLVFEIKVYKNNQQIFGTVYKSVKTKLDARVKVAVSGKEITNDEAVALARGKKYHLDIDTYGYTIDEVKIELSNPAIGTIVREGNEFYLQMTKESISYPEGKGLEFSIISYGQNSETRSGEYVLKASMLEYVLLINNENVENAQIFKGLSDGRIRVAVGNKHDISFNLINGLSIEYDDSIESIRNSVKILENLLLTNGKFEIVTNLTSDDENGTPILNADGTVKVDGNGKYIMKANGFIMGKDQKIKNMYFSADNYSITPLRTQDYTNPPFKVKFNVWLKIQNGIYQVSSTESGGLKIETEIIFDVYSRSSLKYPIPITSYEEFTKMSENSYYILLNDIVIPNDFTPIKTKILGIDGNNYKFKFSGSYLFSGISQIGLFESVQSGAVIQNLNLQILRNSAIYVSNVDSFKLGLITSQNFGSITNCVVESVNFSTLSVIPVKDSGQSSSLSYVAGIAANNHGSASITNSRVELNMVVSNNVAGIACFNGGIISSTYFKNGSIINTSQNSEDKTAGFVLENDAGGKIMNCYISGIQNNSSLIYCDNTSKILNSSQEVSAFVYANNGEISDCYANIPVFGRTFTSGFVYQNGGLITNSYTTSKLENSDKSKHPFVKEIRTIISEGKFENCYFLVDGLFNNSVASNAGYLGLTQLKVPDFNPTEDNLKKYFSTFAISATEKTKGIWFVPERGFDAEFVKDGQLMSFPKNRLELVSPNIISKSELELNDEMTTIDPSTGEIVYSYKIKQNSYAIGTKYNPILISSAKDFESEILEFCNGNINSAYYRLISNISYNEVLKSNLYETVFVGDLEGNGMQISGFVIDSNNKYVNAGLFAKIGDMKYGSGSVKNLNLAPSVVSFPNASCVGTLAGTLEGGNIFNVSVDGFLASDAQGVVVTGKNIVGGLVGRAISNAKIVNIKSEISAKASYMPSISSQVSEESLTYGANKYNSVSYAGGIVGVLDQGASLQFGHLENKITTIAEKAGMIVGFVGGDSLVNQVSVLAVPEGQYVRAHSYGGIIAAEVMGKLSNASVVGNTSIKEYFLSVPKVPNAVGGIVGILKGGVVESCKMAQAIFSEKITVVGGIVGVSTGGTISKCIVDADLTSSLTTGGIIGHLNAENRTNLTTFNINQSGVKARKLSVESVGKSSAYIGGLIGYAENYTSGNITDCYSNANIYSRLELYNQRSSIYAGSLIGTISENKTDGLLINGTITIKNAYANGEISAKMIDKYGDDTQGGAENQPVLPDNSIIIYHTTQYDNNLTPSTNVYVLGVEAITNIADPVRIYCRKAEDKAYTLYNRKIGEFETDKNKFLGNALYSGFNIYIISSGDKYENQIWKKAVNGIPYLAFEN